MKTGRWTQAWCVVGSLFVAVAVQAAKTNYVSLAGTNFVSPYTSWDLATTNIQDAVTDTAAGDTVLVAAGTYWLTNEIAIANAITVKSVAGAAETIAIRTADGTNAPQHRIFNITAAATLDGFTVQNGYLPHVNSPAFNDGAGILMSAGVVQNCVIYSNVIAASYQCRAAGIFMSGSSRLQCSVVVSNIGAYADAGGGVRAGNSSVLISNTIAYNKGSGATLNNSPKAYDCVFENNTGPGVYGYAATLSNCIMRFNTSGNGGGFYGVNGNTLLDCMIVSNTATSQGGGVYLNGGYSPLLFRRCVISGNTNAAYPGIYMTIGFDPTVTRVFELCRITDNQGATSVYITGRPEYVRFRNCTISAPLQVGVDVANLATNAAGDFLYPYFLNTIVYNHATNIFSTNATVLSAILANSFSNSCSPQLTAGVSGNVTGNPKFVAPAMWNYRLKSSSPCAKSGTTNVFAFYKSDLERVPYGQTVNMGCYETMLKIASGTVIQLR